MVSNFISFDEFRNKTSKKTVKIEDQKTVRSQETSPALKEAKQVQVAAATNSIAHDTADLQNKINKAKRQSGLIEKIADKIKGATGLGKSSKKLDAVIEKVKTGEITQEYAEEEIENYRSSQENVAQAVGDIASSGASIATFFAAKQGFEKFIAKTVKINNSKEEFTDALEALSQDQKGIKKKLIDFAFNLTDKHLEKRHTAIFVGTIGAALVGGLVKSLLLSANRIGTKQYKADINKQTMSKKEIKQAKKQAKKQKANANFRNYITGAINGLTTPILSVLGPIGTPIYIGINSLSRYLIGSKENAGKKSINGYIENLKESPIVNASAAVAVAVPAIQKGRLNKVFEKNFDTVVENLQKAQLIESLGKGKTSYEQLEEILFNNAKIKEIMEDEKIEVSSQIQKLSDENIFAVKFKQINSNSDELACALKTDCPPTRDLKEAQELIDRVFPKKYKVEKCVGVGTIAETYLVKQGDEEFCIKVLKKGIDAQKITSDRDKFFAIIDALKDKTPQEKQFLKDNIENIYQGVLAEVDFNNEMRAAQELAKVTKKARLVQPIEVKDGLYVMQKANGISLSDFVNYSSWKWQFNDYKTGKLIERNKFVEEVEEWQRKIDRASDEIRNLKAMLDTEEASNFHKYIWNGNNYIRYNGKDGLSDYIKYLEESLDSRTAYEKKYLKDAQKSLKMYDKFIELQKMGIGELSEKEAKIMLERYQDILVEQFSEINRNGKIIHGDIHPGNIFIDIDALKAGRKDFFTLIDTGNTIQQNQQMAMRFLNLSHYIKNADYENIADFVLEGATLPEGISKVEAREKIVKELKNAFFDNTTYIGKITNDNILSLTDGVMQKLGIIPADTQGNLIKSKTSARQSMDQFRSTYFEALEKQLEKKYASNKKENAMALVLDVMKSTGKMTKTELRFPIKQQMQERKNLALLSPADKAKLKRSASAPKKNSVEFLTYELKQSKKTAEQIINETVDKIERQIMIFEYKIKDMLENIGIRWSQIISEQDVVEKLSLEQKQELKKYLENAQKYARRLPDGELRTSKLEKIEAYMALFS